MAASGVPVFEVNPNPPPRPFAVAAWLGMSPEAIRAGLADGSIAPPPGAPPDWTPPGFGPLPGPLTSSPDFGPAAGANPGGSLVDRSRVRGWFHALDAAFGDTAFDALWQRAGDSDAARATTLAGYLARTLLGAAAPSATDAKDTTAKSLRDTSAALDAFTADPSHRAQIVDLSGMDGAELARRAQGDIGYRYAMSQFDDIALTGNRALFATINADGHLDRFDPDTGENQLSEAWLADRGKFLAWKLAGDAGKTLEIGGDQAWTFIDRAKLDADGLPMTVKLAPGNRAAQQNQVIFGAESAEVIKGSAGTDRIYGGGGDDMLRGASGADHLEGGRGDDIAVGGAGNDELAGNQGNDELDGGRGSDSLDGGSGDDILAGGRGDDHLAGGDGMDTYVIDAGDGTDTIIDTDGRGTIVLDDIAISATRLDVSGSRATTDGRLDFTVDGDPAGERTLTIRAYAAGTDHGGAPDNVIEVRHWHNGDLGITLVGGGPEPGDTGNHTQPGSDNSPTDAVTGGSSGNDAAGTAEGAGHGADTDGTWVDPSIVQAPESDAPPLGVPTSATSFDVNAAIDQLLAPPSTGGSVLDPMRVQHAVAAFAGVLAPPDITSLSTANDAAASGAITLADVADALAHDTGGQDFGHESAATLPRLAPDWYHIEEVAVPVDGASRETRNGMLGVARQ